MVTGIQSKLVGIAHECHMVLLLHIRMGVHTYIVGKAKLCKNLLKT